MDIYVLCHNYTFHITWNGTHFLAIDQRSGHCKTRHDLRTWTNDLGKRETDDALIDCWERGVRDWQALHTPTPKPTRGRGPRPPILPPNRVATKRSRREGNRYD